MKSREWSVTECSFSCVLECALCGGWISSVIPLMAKHSQREKNLVEGSQTVWFWQVTRVLCLSATTYLGANFTQFTCQNVWQPQSTPIMLKCIEEQRERERGKVHKNQKIMNYRQRERPSKFTIFGRRKTFCTTYQISIYHSEFFAKLV